MSWIPVRMFISAAVIVAAIAATGLALSSGGRERSPEPAATVWTLLDRRELSFREDDGGERVVAHVEAALESKGDEARLRILTRACAPDIDPPEGFRGLRGGNRITARELTTLLEAGELQVRTEPEDRDAPTLPGTVGVAARGSVPERRLRADGTLLLLGQSDADMVLDAWAHSAALPIGRSATELVARGKPRLRAIVHVTRDEGGRLRGAIEELTAVSGHVAEAGEHP